MIVSTRSCLYEWYVLLSCIFDGLDFCPRVGCPSLVLSGWATKTRILDTVNGITLGFGFKSIPLLVCAAPALNRGPDKGRLLLLLEYIGLLIIPAPRLARPVLYGLPRERTVLAKSFVVLVFIGGVKPSVL